MMNINLVPESLRKQKKNFWVKKVLRSLPLEIIVGVMGGVFVILVATHILLQGIIFVQLGSHSRVKTNWEQLLPQKRQVDQVLQDIAFLRENISSVEKVTTKRRTLWAPKLNVISDQIPPGVWLQRVSLEGNTLMIMGSSVSKQGNEMISVSNFGSNVKSQDIFMHNVSNIEVSSIKRRMVKDIMAADFTISVKIDERPKK